MVGLHRPSRRFSGLAGADGPVQPSAYVAPRLDESESWDFQHFHIWKCWRGERRGSLTGLPNLCDKPDRVYHIRLPPLGNGDVMTTADEVARRKAGEEKMLFEGPKSVGSAALPVQTALGGKVRCSSPGEEVEVCGASL